MIPQRVKSAVLRLELSELTLKLVSVSSAHAVFLVPLKVNGSSFYVPASATISPKKKLRKKEKWKLRKFK